jgi:hypothetical protein
MPTAVIPAGNAGMTEVVDGKRFGRTKRPQPLAFGSESEGLRGFRFEKGWRRVEYSSLYQGIELNIHCLMQLGNFLAVLIVKLNMEFHALLQGIEKDVVSLVKGLSTANDAVRSLPASYGGSQTGRHDD